MELIRQGQVLSIGFFVYFCLFFFHMLSHYRTVCQINIIYITTLSRMEPGFMQTSKKFTFKVKKCFECKSLL